MERPIVRLKGKMVYVDDDIYDPWWQTDAQTGGEALIEFGGRLCYDSFKNPRPGGNEAYINHIKKVGHGSVLEHSYFSLLIANVSRALTHELIRHRAGMSYSQESQRYVNVSDNPFIPPHNIVQNEEAFHLWTEVMEHSRATYERIVDILEQDMKDLPVKATDKRKIARQEARSVLPNASATRILVTGNVRSWRHFIELRASPGADWEIRQLAVEVYRVLSKESPVCFNDMKVVRLPDGTEAIEVENSKV